MLIDIVSPFSEKTEYRRDGKVMETMILFVPGECAGNAVREEFSNHGCSERLKELIRDMDTEITVLFTDAANRIRVFRSITSHYELYYMVRAGEFMISDHIRNLLCRIPVPERRVDLAGVCDTFLFQHNYGAHTTIREITRLGAGEYLCFENGRLTVELLQKVRIGAYDLRGADGTEVLENTLKNAVETMQREDSINTLSGGVDSALTELYIRGNKSVSACYAFEGFLHEREYALNAAELLHTEHEVYMIPMEEYMDRLRLTIQSFGMSTYNMTAQIMHYTLGREVKESHMFLSEIAGAVYGLGMRRPLTDELRLTVPMEHAHNYANMYGEIARLDDVAYLKRMFGDDIVEESLGRRNKYVLERLEGFDTADVSAENYLQLAHLSFYFTNNATAADEQTEMIFGKTLNTPYSDRKLLESFLSLSLKERYHNAVYGEKPYAKMLLEKRLPGYEVNKQKLGGSLPRTWMITEGPMGDYFHKHDIPEFIPRSMWEEFYHPGWDNSWGVKYAIMHTVWLENVMHLQLEPHASKWRLE